MGGGLLIVGSLGTVYWRVWLVIFSILLCFLPIPSLLVLLGVDLELSQNLPIAGSTGD